MKLIVDGKRKKSLRNVGHAVKVIRKVRARNTHIVILNDNRLILTKRVYK